jgi:hypothetical protein
MKIALLAVLSWVLVGQDAALQSRVVTTVRAAMSPALPFPASDALGSLPATNDTEAFWMVKPLAAGDEAIEVLSNPLNEVNQRRAAAAMAQIDKNVSAAQRRAEDQYQRALAEVQRTGKSQDVAGVTLADEGAAGEKIDAESHVLIEVQFNQREYRFAVAGQTAPSRATATIPDAQVFAVPSHEYDDGAGQRHYKESERLVLMGRVGPADIANDGDRGFRVTSAATPASGAVTSIAIRMRGNAVLMDQILEKSDWSRVLDLLK